MRKQRRFAVMIFGFALLVSAKRERDYASQRRVRHPRRPENNNQTTDFQDAKDAN